MLPPVSAADVTVKVVSAWTGRAVQRSATSTLAASIAAIITAADVPQDSLFPALEILFTLLFFGSKGPTAFADPCSVVWLLCLGNATLYRHPDG
ncbi:MAG: hypothetical protein H0U55_10845 [Rubrobacteraceae bacterium]|nr:hypothetical protein [Rubrobacteraceae bacterium]